MTDWGPDLFSVDKDSSLPIYVQIVNRVQMLVKAGALRPGDRLPSIRSVAERLRVDYNTVARAYTELDRAGLIKTARGIGTHVTESMDEEALQAARKATLYNTLATAVRELLGLGYTPEEIASAFEEYLHQVNKDRETYGSPQNAQESTEK